MQDQVIVSIMLADQVRQVGLWGGVRGTGDGGPIYEEEGQER